MAYSRKDDFTDDGNIEGSDQENQAPDDVSEAYGPESDIGSFEQPDAPAGRGNERREVGLSERLRGIFRDEGNEDLLIDPSGRDDVVLQWLQALDLQIVGACRADERLKPLLKLNVSSGAAEDRLLAHLSQVSYIRFFFFLLLDIVFPFFFLLSVCRSSYNFYCYYYFIFKNTV